MKSSQQGILVALAGQPNCGKSTIFQRLTGIHQQVANYPGVTVEKKSGHYHDHEPERFRVEVVDLPGTYSLTTYSQEEHVTRDFLLHGSPDVVVAVVDASNLRRHLPFVLQVLEMRLPVILCVNMIDVARRRGMTLNVAKLSQALGVPVVTTNGATGVGIADLRRMIREVAKVAVDCGGHGVTAPPCRLPTCGNACSCPDFAEHIATACVTCDLRPYHKSDRIDRLTCHPVLGYVLLVLVMFCAFQLTFSLADGWQWVPTSTHRETGQWYWEMNTPVHFVKTVFNEWLPVLLEPLCPQNENSIIRSLVFDGVLSGVGGVIAYVPVIFFMFLILSFLEQTGYIARVAMMMDRLMRLFGLQGQSAMPMILAGGINGGCAVPAIMSTRNMKDQRERILTILVLPIMNCGGKMPVYLLLVGSFFAAWKGLVMVSLMFISWGIALMCAKILSRTLVSGRASPMLIELPPYQWPRCSDILRTATMQSWWFLKKAGTIILAVNVLLWGMMYFPQQQPGTERNAVTGPTGETVAAEKNRQLANSYAGRFGRLLEPVSRPAGFDWRDNIALTGGFAAKEVIVSSLGTLYSLDDNNNSANTASFSHAPGWNNKKAFAMILFVMVYAPCAATCVVIQQETRKLRWVAAAVGFNTAVAYLLAVLINQVGGLLF